MPTPSTDPLDFNDPGFVIPATTVAVDGSINISSDTIIWTLDDSPILIQNDVTIDSGAILRIMPGVIIKFAANASIIVNGGELLVIGNSPASQHVLFTSVENNAIGGGANTAGPGDWTGLQFGPLSSAEIHGATIEYAANAILFNVDGVGMVDNSIIRYSRDHAFTLDMAGDVDLRHNQIVNNGSSTTPQGGGVFVDQNMTGTLNVESNLIRGNTAANSASIGQGGGIFVSTSTGTTNIVNNLILENSSYNEGGGIYLDGGNVYAESNTITNNSSITGTAGVATGLHIGSTVGSGSQLINNLIYFNVGDEITIDIGAIPDIDFNLTELAFGTNNITTDPQFVANWYLSHQIIAGQATDSPALDTGSPTQPLVITDMTTRTDGGLDTGNTDIGYHHHQGIPDVSTNILFNPAVSTLTASATTTIIVTPQDSSFVGLGVPGLDVTINVACNIGTNSSIRDRGDGSYEFDVTANPSGSIVFQIIVNGTATTGKTYTWGGAGSCNA